MRLDKLKSAWSHHKFLQSVQPLEADEILAIIEYPESLNKSRAQRFLFNLMVFLVLTIFCQSG